MEMRRKIKEGARKEALEEEEKMGWGDKESLSGELMTPNAINGLQLQGCHGQCPESYLCFPDSTVTQTSKTLVGSSPLP